MSNMGHAGCDMQIKERDDRITSLRAELEEVKKVNMELQGQGNICSMCLRRSLNCRVMRSENYGNVHVCEPCLERDALKAIVEKAKHLSAALKSSDYQIEIRCDVNAEDCDHCAIGGLDIEFNQALSHWEQSCVD